MIAYLAEMGNRTRERDKSRDRNRHRKKGCRRRGARGATGDK